jgi:hypothetical protein
MTSASLVTTGSRDGTGAGDHDLPYRFGWRPRGSAPYPFSSRQYVRLLVLRSRIQAVGSTAGASETRSATSSL